MTVTVDLVRPLRRPHQQEGRDRARRRSARHRGARSRTSPRTETRNLGQLHGFDQLSDSATDRSASRRSSATTSAEVLPRASASRSRRFASSPSTSTSTTSFAPGSLRAARRSVDRASPSRRRIRPAAGRDLSKDRHSPFRLEDLTLGLRRIPTGDDQPRRGIGSPLDLKSQHATAIGPADEQPPVARFAGLAGVSDGAVLIPRQLLRLFCRDLRRRAPGSRARDADRRTDGRHRHGADPSVTLRCRPHRSP